MKFRLLVIAVCLTAATTLGAESSHSGVVVAPSKRPTVFIRFDALDLGAVGFQGPWYGSGQGGALLKVVGQWGRARVGLAYLEGWGDIADGVAGPVPIPMPWTVSAGFDIWHNPKRTAFFYGDVPDLYVELGQSLADRYISKAALVCDVDYYGVGLRMEGGEYFSPKYHNTAYFAVMIRVLTFGIGF